MNDTRMTNAGGTWVHSHLPPAGAIVVDSFLLDNGAVRAPRLHQNRFAESSASMGLVQNQADAHRFWREAVETLPAAGRWFPRLEAHKSGELVVWLRPAPEELSALTIWVPNTPDPRVNAAVKGPDLAVLAGLRAEAERRGATDALLLNEAGNVLEAAHFSLLWWDEDTLCLPRVNMPVLPSVTTKCILEHAKNVGVEISRRELHWTQAHRHETWAVNSLHGIKLVTAWRSKEGERPSFASRRTRLEDFQNSVPMQQTLVTE